MLLTICLLRVRSLFDERKCGSSISSAVLPGPIDEDDMFQWEAIILGPKDTPYVSSGALTEDAFFSYPFSQEGGVFVAKLEFVS